MSGCGILFFIIRFPVFLVSVTVVCLFWLTMFVVVLVIGLVWSVLVLIVCAFVNNQHAVEEWFGTFREWVEGIFSNWGKGCTVCWNFLTGGL